MNTNDSKIKNIMNENKFVSVLEGSLVAEVLMMTSRPSGASMSEMMEELDVSDEYSIYSIIHGPLKKKGYATETETTAGFARYFLCHPNSGGKRVRPEEVNIRMRKSRQRKRPESRQQKATEAPLTGIRLMKKRVSAKRAAQMEAENLK